jgi:hypothetical protein
MKAFIIAHKNEIYPMAVTVLFLVSEYLGTSEKFKSSSVFQAIRAGIAKLHAKQEAPKSEQPPAA